MAVFIGFLVVLFVALIIVFKVMQTRELEQANHLMQMYMLSMQEFYSAIQNRIEATRRYRHDLAKHIQTLEHLLEKHGEAQEMQEYMADLQERYSKLKKEQYCTDEIINSIISIKKQQCEKKLIPLKIHIEDAYYGDVREVDMVGLLHNLLDNAIEANERIDGQKQRGITFSMGRKGDGIWIEVSNRICPGEKVTFMTKKEEKDEHGIGTKIIESLVVKYNGKKKITIDEKAHIFCKKIDLLPDKVK
ncbi:GHKL domain-containing protein [Faecalicatena orotica]|uniref:GHKL domain-containing protein n=1 Tax=Faecalicatena orotica TaxID=1544 RepID=UPI00321739E6